VVVGVAEGAGVVGCEEVVVSDNPARAIATDPATRTNNAATRNIREVLILPISLRPRGAAVRRSLNDAADHTVPGHQYDNPTTTLQPVSRLTGRLSNFMDEWAARRSGRTDTRTSTVRAARDVTGATGWAGSRAWDQLSQGSDAYVKSFDPRIPASLHVSQRDQIRNGEVMPVAERCIEDWGKSRTSLSGSTMLNFTPQDIIGAQGGAEIPGDPSTDAK
jgi:hypothetical protein